jgi:hypothetical protein
MNLADVVTVVLVILGLLTAFVGCWLMAAGLFPRRTERCAEAIGEAPIKCAVIGLGGMAPLITLGIAAGRVSQSAPAKLASFLIIVTTLLIAVFGAAGLARRIGGGLSSARDQGEPWRNVLRGGIVLAITFLTLVLIPVTLLLGFGAFVRAGMRRRAPATVPVPAAT